MDKTSLVADDLDEGRRFVAALERAGLPVAVGMWFKKASSDDWMLGVATPDVQVHGPLSVMRFAEHVRRDGFEGLISRDNTTYFNTSSSFFSSVTPRSAIVDGEILTIENFSLNGVEIDKALIFHLARDVAPSNDPPSVMRTETVRNRRGVA